jgi:hypothetical protein
MKVTKRNKDFLYALNQYIKNVEKEDVTFFDRLCSGKRGILKKEIMITYHPKVLKFEEVGTMLKAFLKLSKDSRKKFVSSSVWKRKIFIGNILRIETEDVKDINLSSYKKLSACKKYLDYLIIIMLHIRWAFRRISLNDYHFCKYITNNATRNLLSPVILSKAIQWGVKINSKKIFRSNNYKLINIYFKSLTLEQRKRQIENYKGKSKLIKNRLLLLSHSCSDEAFKDVCIKAVTSITSFRVMETYFRARYFNHISQEVIVETILDISEKYIFVEHSNNVCEAKETIKLLIERLKKEYKILCLGVLRKSGDHNSIQSRYIAAFLSSNTSIL